MIEVLSCGGTCSIQDAGRFGYRHLGLAQAGVMDDQAFHQANLLLGNEESAAVLEFGHGTLHLRFHGATDFVLTGAICQAELKTASSQDGEGAPVTGGFLHHAPAGSVLRLRQPLPPGMYGLLAVRGGFDVPVILGSRSCDTAASLGGHEGRFLRRGDQLPVSGALPDKPLHAGFRPLASSGELHAFPGPEYALFPEETRQAFWHHSWQITSQSNRMGFRLSGIPLHQYLDREMASSGILPGMVQVPPDGQPILLGKDAQCTGGYPRLACVLEADLWQLANLGSGATVRFRPCDSETAHLINSRYAAYRQRLEAGLQLASDFPVSRRPDSQRRAPR